MACRRPSPRKEDHPPLHTLRVFFSKQWPSRCPWGLLEMVKSRKKCLEQFLELKAHRKLPKQEQRTTLFYNLSPLKPAGFPIPARRVRFRDEEGTARWKPCAECCRWSGSACNNNSVQEPALLSAARITGLRAIDGWWHGRPTPSPACRAPAGVATADRAWSPCRAHGSFGQRATGTHSGS
jgi:hypothetical protein